MDANFFNYSILIDIYKATMCVCAFVNFFFKEIHLRNCLLDFYKFDRNDFR